MQTFFCLARYLASSCFYPAYWDSGKKRKPSSHCDSRVSLELLGRFELPTSSLPTDCKPGNRWYPAVSGPFCSGKVLLSVLSAPLSPPDSFAVWVRLWVNTQPTKLCRIDLLKPYHPLLITLDKSRSFCEKKTADVYQILRRCKQRTATNALQDVYSYSLHSPIHYFWLP